MTVLVACSSPSPAHADATTIKDAAVAASTALVAANVVHSTASVLNNNGAATIVYVAFGADSSVLPAAWKSFCKAQSALNCSFPLAAGASQALPLAGYLNATLSFGAPVTCGSTKAELNLNNPQWFDVTDVSLVDGYSNNVLIDVTDASGKHVLGPPKGKVGNSKVFGLFPLGCDICTARQSPPCGMSPGKGDCKGGTQYKPDIVCQYQGATKGGGSTVKVVLEK